MKLTDINPATMRGPGDDQPTEDRVTCWACDGSFPSDCMVDGYIFGPVCERCADALDAGEPGKEKQDTGICVWCEKESTLDTNGTCQWCAEDKARAKYEAILFPPTRDNQ